MSGTTVRLLQAAAEIVGGPRPLAYRLGISEALLSRFMEDRRELPDGLLLRAVDIVLGDLPGRRLVREPGSVQPQDVVGASDAND